MIARTLLKIFGLAAAAALGLSLAAQASDGVQACTDAWDYAPASDVCTNSSVGRISASSATNAGFCRISGISCSVSATDSSGNAVSWSWTGSSTRSVTDTEELDVCFQSGTTGPGGYTAYFFAGCGTGETPSSEMNGSTLTAPAT